MATYSGDAQQIKRALNACPITFSQDATLTPIKGPSTHAVYTIQQGRDVFVVKKLFDESFTALDRNQVFNCQTELARQGLAAEPVWYDVNAGIWLERFLPSVPLPVDMGAKIELLAKLLASIHFTPLTHPPEPLNLPKQWRDYLSCIPQHQHKAYAQDIEYAMHQWQTHFTQNEYVLCHNDLAFEHVLNNARPMAVDWEYVAMGDRYFDLASAVAVNNLSPSHANHLYACYGEHTGIAYKIIKSGAENSQSMVQVTNALWYAAKSTLPL